jgi:outer membrane protein insertion porin family
LRAVAHRLAAWATLVHAAVAQDAPRPARHADEGKKVAFIEVEPAGMAAETAKGQIALRVGEPLSRRVVEEDLRNLWSTLRIPALVEVRDTEDGGVGVVYRIKESPVYARAEFKGLDHFTQAQVNTFLKLSGTIQITLWSARQQAQLLEELYRRDGYYHARVRLKPDEASRTLLFLVDEGPRVTVRNVHFRGNRSFPGTHWWRFLRETLIGAARLENEPAYYVLLVIPVRGAGYSEHKLQQDLERLRLFYRRKGFRDAQVELVERSFTRSLDEVDLTFLIEEGRRYRISATDVEVIPPAGQTARYRKDELLALMETQPGDFYDRDVVSQDMRALERFYGERGHPSSRRYGAGLKNTFVVEEPQETFDADAGTVKLLFRVHEGSPKMVRDVVITGNSGTKDRVIRRHIRNDPGQRLDMVAMERSRNALEALNYFNSVDRLSGVHITLEPVPEDQDQVDLHVEVEEGDTGSLTWGIGYSTDLGAQGSIQFRKRNFDIGRLPSSANPITVIEEIADNQAFHGGGQDLDISFQPGTRRTLFQVRFFEPDLFHTHKQAVGLRVNGYKAVQQWESFVSDSLGGTVGLVRRLNDEVSLSVAVGEESSKLRSIEANAPTLVWEAAGRTELRSVRFQADYDDLDHPLRPASGVRLSGYYQLFGGLLGGESEFFTAGVNADSYWTMFEDDYERPHVLHFEQTFDVGGTFQNTRDVYPTRRFYMGGANLRGFNRRQAGPTQFGQPTGGEARYLATLEYAFPMISTRLEGTLRETEIVRGVLLADFGLLGTTLTDDSFGEPRLALGGGVRFFIPGFNLPMSLYLAWAVMHEETDSRRQVYFSFSPFQ